MLPTPVISEGYDALRRSVRLLMLLDGSERAGIAPMRVSHLHTYAYLSNVLAPVWDETIFDGRLLKRRSGPFYPELQHDLDRLVGRGLVSISDLAHVIDQDGQWRLEGAFSLNYELARNVLDAIVQFPQETAVSRFLLELAYALSALTEEELDALATEDPTYSDEIVVVGNVVDFLERGDRNYSANAARYFRTVSDHVTPGDLLHLYVRHLRRRLNAT